MGAGAAARRDNRTIWRSRWRWCPGREGEHCLKGCAVISAERLGHPTKTALTLGPPVPRAVMLWSILTATLHNFHNS